MFLEFKILEKQETIYLKYQKKVAQLHNVGGDNNDDVELDMRDGVLVAPDPVCEKVAGQK